MGDNETSLSAPLASLRTYYAKDNTLEGRQCDIRKKASDQVSLKTTITHVVGQNISLPGSALSLGARF